MSLSSSLVPVLSNSLVTIKDRDQQQRINLWPVYFINCKTDDAKRKRGIERLDDIIKREKARNPELVNDQDEDPALKYFIMYANKNNADLEAAREFFHQQSVNTSTVEPKQMSELDKRKFEANALIKSWMELPTSELQTRLNKGEILPTNEWLPTSGEKKPLLDQEVAAHLEFGEKLRIEGNEAYEKYLATKSEKSLELADLRYTQGIRLLENVCSEPASEVYDLNSWEIKHSYHRFLRNAAQTSLLTYRYDLCISYCNTVLADDQFDIKTRYRRGLAYLHESEILKSKLDFQTLRTKEGFENVEEARNAGDSGIRKLRKVLISWKEDARKMLVGSTDAEIFSSSRNENTSESIGHVPSPQSTIQSRNPLIAHRELVDSYRAMGDVYIAKAELVQIIRRVIDYLTNQDVLDKINSIKVRSNFDPKTYINILRKEILGPLHEYIFKVMNEICPKKIEGLTIEEAVRTVYEKSTHYHMSEEQLTLMNDINTIDDISTGGNVAELYHYINGIIWEFVD